MTITRSGHQAEEQAKSEKAKIKATNAKIAELTQMKSKVATAKLKMNIFLRKLRMGLLDYRDLKDEVGEESERDAIIVVIQKKWPKVQASSNELEETMAELWDAFSKATSTELKEDPYEMIPA